MNRDEFLDKQYSISHQTGMNQRYHQRYANFWWRCDTGSKIFTALSSVVGVMLSVVTFIPDHDAAFDVFGLILSFLGACSAVALNVIPFGNWEQCHRVFLIQWTELRKDIDALLYDLAPGDPSPELVLELKRIDAKVHLICGAEPPANEKVLMECHKEEEKSRTLPNAAAA